MKLDEAIKLAVSAHDGQTDRHGDPYILHPMRVLLAASDEDGRVVGILHDVLEKTSWTMDQLRSRGLTIIQENALDGVTRRPNEDYFEFVERAGKDHLGRLVKVRDLKDNIASSLSEQQDEDRDRRLLKYTTALAMLENG